MSLYRRADGAVLTRDCPKGIADAATERRRGAAVALALAAMFAASIGMTQAAWSMLGAVASLPHDGGSELITGDLEMPDDVEMGEMVPMEHGEEFAPSF